MCIGVEVSIHVYRRICIWFTGTVCRAKTNALYSKRADNQELSLRFSGLGIIDVRPCRLEELQLIESPGPKNSTDGAHYGSYQCPPYTLKPKPMTNETCHARFGLTLAVALSENLDISIQTRRVLPKKGSLQGLKLRKFRIDKVFCKPQKVGNRIKDK